ECEHEFAQLQQATRQPDAADLYRSALSIWTGLAIQDPSYRQKLAYCHRDYGFLLRETGQQLLAIEEQRQAILVWKQLVVELPAKGNYLAELAAEHRRLAALLRVRQAHEEAISNYQEGIEIQTRFTATLLPDTFYRKCVLELVGMHIDLALLLRE